MKRHRIAEWIRKHEPHLCCLQETHLRTKDLHRLKERVENTYSKKTDRKKRWGKRKKVILISDKVDFKRRAIKRHPEGHFIIFKGRIHPEFINMVNVYAPNIRALKYIKKILEDFKKDIDSNRGF